jgi:hypothetical protein
MPVRWAGVAIEPEMPPRLKSVGRMTDLDLLKIDQSGSLRWTDDVARKLLAMLSERVMQGFPLFAQ